MSKQNFDDLIKDGPEEIGLASRKVAQKAESAVIDDTLIRNEDNDFMSDENIEARVLAMMNHQGPLPDVWAANPERDHLIWGSTSKDASPALYVYQEMGAKFAKAEHVAAQFRIHVKSDSSDNTEKITVREMVLLVMPKRIWHAYMLQNHHKEPAKTQGYFNDDGMSRSKSMPIGYVGLMNRKAQDALASREDVLFTQNHTRNGVLEPVKKPKAWENLEKRNDDPTFFERNHINPDDY